MKRRESVGIMTLFVSVHLWRYLFPVNGRLAFKREAISMKKPNSKYVESVVKKAA